MPANQSNLQEQDRPVGVAIIGAGERGVYYVGSRMAELARETGFVIRVVHDRLPDRARLASQYLTDLYRTNGLYWQVELVDDMAAAIERPDVDLVLVTTHTNAHVEPVQIAARAGKRIYLDKPISVTLEDAEAIAEAERASGKPIMMGFTRRYERPWIEAINMAREGRIGIPQMVLLRSVIPYTRYLQLWHRTNAASGGAINDKGSHHFDVLNWITASKPLTLSATGGRSTIFKADPNAPARCSDCNRDCPFRRHETLIDIAEGVAKVPNASWLTAARIADRNDNCVYLPGSDIDDHMVATVRYDNSMVATLFFTIFGPYAEDQETLEIIGSSGRLRMERHSGSIDLVSQHGHKRETIDMASPDRDSSHFGADKELVRTLRRFVDGDVPIVGVPEGHASLRLVSAAQKSLQAGGRIIDLDSLEFL